MSTEEPKSVLSLNEPQTRYLIIDPGLKAAGWNLEDRTQIRFEVPVGPLAVRDAQGVYQALTTPDTNAVATSPAEAARLAREKAEAELAELQARIAPLEKEINQLGRQFWVTKDQVRANNYDLSASRYRQIEQEEVFYEKPAVTLDRMRQLDAAAEHDVAALNEMLAKP